MSDLRPFLPPGRRVTAQLVQGPLYRGSVRRVVDGWLLLETESGLVLINLSQVAVISQEAGDTGDDVEASLEGLDELPKPTSAERPTRTSRAPARPWKDDDLKQLADAFLDGADDSELASRFNRTRGQVKELRQGFECARGNLVEDQISSVAATWIDRWRRVLSPR
jgi:hypothetical protein